MCLLAVAVLACSCAGPKETIQEPGGEAVAPEVPGAERVLAEETVVSKVAENLKGVLEEPVVHVVAEEELRDYRETWGDETPHVDVFYDAYMVRFPLDQVGGYVWDAAREQLETGEFGPVLLNNGWEIWLGYFERVGAISHDLSLSVRDTCDLLSTSGNAEEKRAVRRFCTDFKREFVFSDDLELYRRLWHSPFKVDQPTGLGAREALETLFLAETKRLLAPPSDLDHVAELEMPHMKGFEFGSEASENSLSAELFDERNHVTVLFLPPEKPSEPLEDGFRGKVLASIRRHGQWIPGLRMIEKAEEVMKLPDLENAKDIGVMLLFSSLQYPDHRTRAARMLTKLVGERAPEQQGIIEMLKAVVRGEGRE